MRAEMPTPAKGRLLYDVLGFAAIVVIVLKLTAVLTLSWWWVLAPLWLNLALFPLVIFGWMVGARRWFRSGEWLRTRRLDETAER